MVSHQGLNLLIGERTPIFVNPGKHSLVLRITDMEERCRGMLGMGVLAKLELRLPLQTPLSAWN